MRSRFSARFEAGEHEVGQGAINQRPAALGERLVVLAQAAPTVTSPTTTAITAVSAFTPASGAAGTTVTITGTNLQNAVGLSFFRNVAGTGFTVVSSTQVSVVVRAGAKTGLLTVLTGSGSNNSSTKFTVTP